MPDRSPSSTTLQVPFGNGTRCVIQLKSIGVRVLCGDDAGLRRSFSLPVVRIGTGPDNDLVLTDRTVSRYHAELKIDPQGLRLTDLGSTNGTFVNQVRVGQVFLEPGMECQLGTVRLAVCQELDERQSIVDQERELGELVGASLAMKEVYACLRAVAPTVATVLVTGESGTGKEVVARTVHRLSGRTGPLVTFDAASADREMMRSELFGHVRGAFTGAAEARQGAFRHAHTGTLFLDEVGELPLELQPRLLRVLETRQVTPVGSDDPVPVNVRVVAATNRDLPAMVAAGTFREDLFHRLDVVSLVLPPLRDRREDIPLLVDHFVRELSLSCRFGEDSLQALCDHPWPGNVRELRNLLERVGIMRAGGAVSAADLGLSRRDAGRRSPARAPADLDASVRAAERDAIVAALREHRGNRLAAAKALGISLATLKRRLSLYGIGVEK